MTEISLSEETDPPNDSELPPWLEPLLGLVASGRTDRLEELALEGAPPEIRLALREVREGFATLGIAERPEMPSLALRDRILATLRSQAQTHARTSRRAVLVLDMLNDHLTEGMPFEVPRARAIVPALAERLRTARREGDAVIYVMDAHDPEDEDLDAWGAHNVRGTKGAEVWPALAPMAGDRLVNKSTFCTIEAG
jgi:hypothetical protein